MPGLESDASAAGGGESPNSASDASEKKKDSPKDAKASNSSANLKAHEGIATRLTTTRASPTKDHTITYDGINEIAAQSLKALKEFGSKFGSPAKKKRPTSVRSANGTRSFYPLEPTTETRNLSSSGSSDNEDIPDLIFNTGTNDSGNSMGNKYNRTNIRRASSLGLNLDEQPVLRPTKHFPDYSTSYERTHPSNRSTSRTHDGPVSRQSEYIRREPRTPHITSSFQAPKTSSHNRSPSDTHLSDSKESNAGSGVVLNRIESMIADSRASSSQSKPRATMYLPQTVNNNDQRNDIEPSIPEIIGPELSEKPRLQAAPDISSKLKEYRSLLNQSPNKPISARTSPIHHPLTSEQVPSINFNYERHNESDGKYTPGTHTAPVARQSEQRRPSVNADAYEFPRVPQLQTLAPSPVFPSESMQESASITSSGSIDSNFKIHSGLRRHGTPSTDQSHTLRQSDATGTTAQPTATSRSARSNHRSPAEGPVTDLSRSSSDNLSSYTPSNRYQNGPNNNGSHTSLNTSLRSRNEQQTSRPPERTVRENSEQGISPVSNKSTPTPTASTPPTHGDVNTNAIERSQAINSNDGLPGWGGARWKAFVKVVHESLASSETSGIDIDSFLGRVRDNLPDEMQDMTFVEFTRRFHTWQNIAERNGFL